MTWKIKFTTVAEKQFAKLSKEYQKRIYVLLKRIESDPRIDGKALKGSANLKLWRYRVGDYRIICQIIDMDVTVVVVKIGHRSDIYD